MINSSFQNVTMASSAMAIQAGNKVSESGRVLPEAADLNQNNIAVTAASSNEAQAPIQEESVSTEQDLNAATAQKMVEKMNDMIQFVQRDLEFTVDEESGRTIFKVIHTDTGDVIRQVPSEEALALAEALADGRASLIRDQA